MSGWRRTLGLESPKGPGWPEYNGQYGTPEKSGSALRAGAGSAGDGRDAGAKPEQGWTGHAGVGGVGWGGSGSAGDTGFGAPQFGTPGNE